MLLPLYLMSCARVHSAERKADAGARVRSPERRADAGALAQAGSGEGKKQVAAMLGVQTLRASTRPRPFLRLSPQHLAVQARPRQPRSHRQASCAYLPLIYNKTLTCKRNKALTRMLRHMSGTCMHALSRALRRYPARCGQLLKRSVVNCGTAEQPQPREPAAAARRRRRAKARASCLRPSSAS